MMASTWMSGVATSRATTRRCGPTWTKGPEASPDCPACGTIRAMKKILKITAWAVAGIVVVAGIAIGGAMWMGERKMQRTVSVNVTPVAYASGEETITQGRYLF